MDIDLLVLVFGICKYIIFVIDRVGLEKAKKELAGSIEKGISFIRK